MPLGGHSSDPEVMAACPSRAGVKMVRRGLVLCVTLKEESARSLDRWNVGWKINRGVRDDAKALAGAPERLELSIDSEHGWSRFGPGRAGEEMS